MCLPCHLRSLINRTFRIKILFHMHKSCQGMKWKYCKMVSILFVVSIFCSCIRCWDKMKKCLKYCFINLLGLKEAITTIPTKSLYRVKMNEHCNLHGVEWNSVSRLIYAKLLNNLSAKTSLYFVSWSIRY